MIVFWYSMSDGLCGGVNNYTCFEKFVQFSIMLFIFVPAFIFSLITYWMTEGIFRTWIKFTVFFVPLYVLAAFLALNLEHGGMMDIYGNVGGLLIYFLLIVYVVISLTIITFKFISLRGKKI